VVLGHEGLALSIWFIVWVFLVVFICGIFGWSMQILIKQKRSWADFAKKNGLQYIPGPMMRSPAVQGTYKNFPLAVYSEEQPTPDQRGRQFRTIIQVELPSGMPVEGVVASSANRSFAEGLIDLTETVKADYPGWDDSILIKTRDAELLKPFFNNERYRSLLALMTIKSISCVFIFDLTSTFLRLETADPFHEMGKLERICSKIIDQARVLMVETPSA
jgi:hypothetical protein